MNIDRLLIQEPFNRWVVRFIREYVQHGHNVYISKIGNRAFTTDAQLVDMFFAVMLRERDGALLYPPELDRLFGIWYEENAAYHTNFRPPVYELINRLESKYDRVRVRSEFYFSGVELIVNTVEETKELIASREHELQFRLPDFESEIVKE